MKKRASTAVIFLCCWFTYLTAYLCRVNFSSAMNTLSGELALSVEQLGTVGAIFYGVYAMGQLVNGTLGDHVPTPLFLSLALLGTGLCNMGMALSRAFVPLCVCWGLNGCFQSMFWCSIIRLLAQNIAEQQRAKISAGISFAMPAAYLVSWCLLGQGLAKSAAKWYFLVPCVAAGVMLVVWLLLARRLDSRQPVREGKPNLKETMQYLKTHGLLRVLPICLLHGLIKEGVGCWMPLLIAQFLNTSVSPYLLAAIMPCANVMGIYASRMLLQSGFGKRSPYRVLVLFFSGIILLGVGLMLETSGLVIVGTMALVSALCYGNNTVLMSFIPMQYVSDNIVSSIVGIFDFSSYVGAAISTYALGKLLSNSGFAPLPVIWTGAGAVLLGMTLLLMRAHKQRRTE